MLICKLGSLEPNWTNAGGICLVAEITVSKLELKVKIAEQRMSQPASPTAPA